VWKYGESGKLIIGGIVVIGVSVWSIGDRPRTTWLRGRGHLKMTWPQDVRFTQVTSFCRELENIEEGKCEVVKQIKDLV
jgi:hypothetical protein